TAAGNVGDVDAILIDTIFSADIVRCFNRESNAVGDESLVAAVVGANPDEVMLVEHVEPFASRHTAPRPGAGPHQHAERFVILVIRRQIKLETFASQIDVADLLVPLEAFVGFGGGGEGAAIGEGDRLRAGLG